MRIAGAFLLGLLFGIGAPQIFVVESASALLSAASLFKDVKEGEYYDESVLDLVRKGIVQGYDDGRFGPNDPVTRGQVVVMLKRYHHNVVLPLQKEVEYLLRHLDLGECGDGLKGQWEQCDDGNVVGGDGCSEECLKEYEPKRSEPLPTPSSCGGGHAIGDRFVADDGCNTCTCTEGGIACTEMGCSPQEKDVSCEKIGQRLADLMRSNRACRTDDDCRLLVRPCSPFLTCGQAVNTGGLGKVKEAIGEFAKVCLEERDTCVECPDRGVVCSKGFCRVDPPIVCTEDARVCPDGTTVGRNPDSDCEFDPCSETSTCGNGVCEEGETP